MNTIYYKIQGYGEARMRGNRYEKYIIYDRYMIDRYAEFDGKMFFDDHVAWHYSTAAEAMSDLLRIKADDEASGHRVEVLA